LSFDREVYSVTSGRKIKGSNMGQQEKPLIEQYKDEIDELLVESEHVYRLTIDYQLLDQKISELIIRAKSEGVAEQAIWNLIHARIPSYVNYINHKALSKKVA
jgi:uncharacterized protein YdcH (DUF465 family)